MERAVILWFPSNESRELFIKALSLSEYTLHQKKSILYCRLTKENIEQAIKSFDAKDISYNDAENNFSKGFLDAYDVFFH